MKRSLSLVQKSQTKVIVRFDELEDDEYADGNGSKDALSLTLWSGPLR